MTVLWQRILNVGRWCFSTEIQHLCCVILQKDAFVHLVKSYFLLFDLLTSETELLLLLDEGVSIAGVDVGMLSRGNEAVSTMFFILFLF